MRTQDQLAELVPLTGSDELFHCRVQKTSTSGVEDLQVSVSTTKDNTPAGKCEAARASLWRMEQKTKEEGLKVFHKVAEHGLSSKTWLLFPSGSPAPKGVEVDTWYNVSIPVVTLTVSKPKQSTTGITQENKETKLFFELLKPNLVGIGAKLPPDAVLSVRRCPTGQFNARNEAATYFREKEAAKQKTHWGSVRADRLLDDNQWGDFAKMFVSSKSTLHDNLFDCEQNGELMFLIIEYCNVFSKFSSFFYDDQASQKFHQSLRVGTSSGKCGDTLLSSANTLRVSRNTFAHKFERMLRSPSDTEILEYQKIIESVENFLDAVQAILKHYEEGCILEDEKNLHQKAVHATANALGELQNSGPNIHLNDRMLAELIRSIEDTITDREIMVEKIKHLRQLADLDTSRSMCSLVAQSGSFLHAFLSGDCEKTRKNLESEKTLFEALYSKATKTQGLGPHCDGFPWPKSFSIDLTVPHGERNEDTNVTALTGLRLVSDVSMSGYERHADAISKSMMYIPVFTSESLQQLCQHDSDPTDASIFLFQLILARELHETSKIMMKHQSSSARNLYPCALLRPIFLLTPSKIDELESSLRQEHMTKLTQLQRCARQQLEKMGLKVIEQDSLSPHGLFNYYKDKKVPDRSIDDTAAILLKEISAEIQNLYMESMAYNFPQSLELSKFLSDAAMSRYAPILARHSIHSVQSFSTLDVATSCLASVAQAAAISSHLTPAIESKLLLDAVAIARKSPLAQPINVRFDKYVDQDASFCTAAFSSSGIDIFFSKKLTLVVFALGGFLAFVLPLLAFLSISGDDDFSCAVTPAIDTRWLASRWLSTLWLLSLGLISSSAVSYFRDPKLAKYIFSVFLILNVIEIVLLEMYLYDRYVYQLCPGNTSNYLRDCCLIDGVIHDDDPGAFVSRVLASKMSLPTWYFLRLIENTIRALFFIILAIFCVTKQSFVFVFFLSSWTLNSIYTILFYISLGAPVGPTIANNLNQLTLASLCVLKALHWYGQRISSEIAEKEAGKLKCVFSNLKLKDEDFCQCFESLTHKSSAVQQHSDIARFFEVSEFINGAFQVAHAANLLHAFVFFLFFISNNFIFLFQTWIGSLLKRGPGFKEQGLSELFDSPLPECMAKLNHVDALKLAMSKRDPSWTQPKGTFIKGPIKDVNRAISKIYRAYAGDVRRITDIVRCSVVLDTMKDINHFLLMLEEVCWIEKYDFNDAKQRVRQAENPLNFCNWSVIDWRQKMQLLLLFVWSYFTLYFLGLPPQYAENPIKRSGAFEIVRVKNRFKEESPVGGYRDVNIKVRIGFKSSLILNSPVFVPVEHWDDAGVQTVVCEIQVTPDNVLLLFCFPSQRLAGSLTEPLRRNVEEQQSA